MILKTKYGKVDTKISYIARRAELALYSQAYSAREYRNPQTLNRRLHALVVKLHLNNLTAKEDIAFEAEEVAYTTLGHKRQNTTATDGQPSFKRPRACCTDASSVKSAGAATSPLFFDGNSDLLANVCSFLDARAVLQCSMTCAQAAQQIPAYVTTIELTMSALERLSVVHRARFFTRFVHLERFTLQGSMSVKHFDFQKEGVLIAHNVICRGLMTSLRHLSLPKLTHFGINFAYTEGLQDRITSQIAWTLLGNAHVHFPRLHELSLAGNCISDDGVLHVSEALTFMASTTSAKLARLNLEHNFIGERGLLQLQEAARLLASKQAAISICCRDNILAQE